MSDEERRTDQVLLDLADVVAAMSSAAESDAVLVQELVKGQATYESTVRALLTGKEIPGTGNPAPGGNVAVPHNVAMDMAGMLKMSLLDGADGAGQRGQSRAKELDAVKKKEQEEKEGGGGGSKVNDSMPKLADPGIVKTGSKTIVQPRNPEGSITSTPVPSGSAEPGPGTIVNPPTSSGPPQPTGRTPPPVTTPPPAGPEIPPTVTVSKKPKVRRCFEFSIRNTTDKPVSDLHFPADVQLSGTPGSPIGWFGNNYSNSPGFGFQLKKDSTAVIPPGRELEPFEFCVDGEPFSVDAMLSHPDQTLSPVQPGQVRVNGRAAPFRGGQVRIRPKSRSYVHEVEVTTGSGGSKEIRVSVRNGLVTDFGDFVNPDIGLSGFMDRRGEQVGVRLFGTGPGPATVPGGRTATLTIVTSSSRPSFKVEAGSEEE